MIQPPFLRKGDKVAIVSPARSISFEEVFPTMKLLQKWDLEVVLGTHVFGKHHQFSGTDEQRGQDLQQMLDDPSIRAVIASRGGYGAARIIDRLDFKRFAQHPKWIVGYSDCTVLHSHIHRHLGIQTLHATMPYNIKEQDISEISQESLRKALFGEKISYSKHITFWDRTGLTEGELVGGNLSILYSLSGTPSDIDTKGKILLLEDVEEYLYHLDRMMMNLKRSGKLKELKGLIVGGLTEMKDNEVPFGKGAQEIIQDAVKDYEYPVCFDFPSGHDKKNVALFLGRKVKFIVDEEISLLFD
ncbi:MAG: LD-carboxypeptidase [Bacteroidales bacterium]|nr:LD-carboxypeptidase [Deltaproteobacteria bacterium]MBL7138731.1 LD-carboxypeptidase [Bacteroidales bacterium]